MAQNIKIIFEQIILDKGAVQFLFRISHVDQLLPKIAKKLIVTMNLFWVQDIQKIIFYVIKHHNHKFKLTQ